MNRPLPAPLKTKASWFSIFLFTVALIFAGVLAAHLTGCATAPDGSSVPDTARIALVTREAAAIGTAEALFRYPEWKPDFVSVVAQLKALEAEPNITVNAMLGIIARLPVNELRSRDAQLAISGARLVVAAAGWSDVEITRTEQLRPVVTALREGLELGGAKD